MSPIACPRERDRGQGPAQVLRRRRGRRAASTCTSSAARCSRCSAPTAPARPPPSEILEGYRGAHARRGLGARPRPRAQRARALKARIGIVLQSTGVDPYLTVRGDDRDVRAATTRTRGRSDEVIELVGLDREARHPREQALRRPAAAPGRRDRARRATPSCSSSTSRRPASTRRAPADAWEIVKNLTALGKTVFLTTHFMDEAQYLADRVAVIARGRDRRRGPARRRSAGRDAMQARDPVPAARRGAPEPPASAAAAAGRTARSRSAPTTRRRPCTTLTGWALEHGVALRRRSRSRRPTPRGRLPGAHGRERRRRDERRSRSPLRQVRYTNKAFWRNPASAFFTFAFPLMFLVIFTALLGSGKVD